MEGAATSLDGKAHVVLDGLSANSDSGVLAWEAISRALADAGVAADPGTAREYLGERGIEIDDGACAAAPALVCAGRYDD